MKLYQSFRFTIIQLGKRWDVRLDWEQVLRSTGLSSTIQIEEKLFDDLQKL
jgi:hypothetical protein